jgi:hypothetical protein
MEHRTTSGRIDYITDGSGLMGFEEFRITSHEDGSRVLRAYCEMFNDRLIRDVHLSVDAGWRPQTAFVELRIDDRLVGSGHYMFGDETVELQRVTAAGGRELLSRSLPGVASTFGSHSLQNDAWMYAAFDAQRGTQQDAVMENAVVCSRLPNGGDGPDLHLSAQHHRYLDNESVTTPAGRFDCRHYQFLFEQWPPIHYWIHGDDYLLVRCRWDLFNQTYELAKLGSS